jgi:hypothetical protein
MQMIPSAITFLVECWRITRILEKERCNAKRRPGQLRDLRVQSPQSRHLAES